MATWLEQIQTALRKRGGIASLEDLYTDLKGLRQSALTKSWKTTVRRTILNHSSDSKGIKGPNLFYSVKGIGAGVWGLRSSLKQTPRASDFEEPNVPGRVRTEIYRILRDTDLARKLKALHKGACQICGRTLRLGNGDLYSEAHHVQPLGAPHNGSDTADNILVLCPNHHVLLDYGAISLDAGKLRTLQGHIVNNRYIQYHNDVVLSGKDRMRSNPAPQRPRKGARR